MQRVPFSEKVFVFFEGFGKGRSFSDGFGFEIHGAIFSYKNLLAQRVYCSKNSEKWKMCF